MKQSPCLAEGETLPDRPSYWLIFLVDGETREPRTSRCCWDKVLTPLEASQRAFGIEPSPNMVFFNLSPGKIEACKRIGLAHAKMNAKKAVRSKQWRLNASHT